MRRTTIAVTRGPTPADAHAILAGARNLAMTRTRPDVLVMSRPALSIELLQFWPCPVLLFD